MHGCCGGMFLLLGSVLTFPTESHGLDPTSDVAMLLSHVMPSRHIHVMTSSFATPDWSQVTST